MRENDERKNEKWKGISTKLTESCPFDGREKTKTDIQREGRTNRSY